MTAREIAEKTNRPIWKIYYLKNKLGRLPTIEEVINYKPPRGAPIKYKTEEGAGNENYNKG